MEQKRQACGGGNEISARRTTRASLCEDLVTEIFSRLPARSAARCAALSRRWRKLINDPDFWIHHHCPPWPDLNIAYVHEYPDEPGEWALQHAFHLVDPPRDLAHGFLSSIHHRLAYRYAGTCNGLVALQVQGLYDPRFFACVVLNPATTEEASLVYLGLGEERHLCGFGYGPESRTYKLLVVSRERGCFYGGPLQVLSLAGDGRGEARTVFPEADGSTTFSLCIGGKVYLLDERRLRVLAFDVDNETISTVQLPAAGIVCSDLMEVGTRLCIAMHNEDEDEILLWLLTSSLEWERRCALRHVAEPRDWSFHCWVVGAWDCGENRLLAWYRGQGLRLYDMRGMASYAGAREPAGRWTLEDQTDSGDHLRRGYGQYRLCWGYRPTAISPKIAVGNCTGMVPPVLCSFRSSRRTPERPRMQFFDVLSGLVRALLLGEEI
jgi:F-box interacting protein